MFNGIDRLWGYNEFEEKFYSFDLSSRELLDSFSLHSSGPNAVPPIFGFKVIGEDSLLINANHHRQLTLINKSGEILDAWSFHDIDLPKPGRTRGLYFPYTNQGIPGLDYNPNTSEVSFFILNNSDEGGSHNFSRFKYPPYAIFNLESGDFSRSFGFYPEEYLEEDKSDYRVAFPFIRIDKDFYGSFYHSHSMIRFGIDDTEQIEMRSEYTPLRFDFLPRGMSYKDRDPLLIPISGYHNILYDPYAKNILRIVRHELKEEMIDHDPLNWDIRKKANWSIMIIDDKGKLLGEHFFAGGIYNFDHIIPTRKGILISKENFNNPDNEEEKLTFSLFEYNKLTQT